MQNGNREDSYKSEILSAAYQHEFAMHTMEFDTISKKDLSEGLNLVAEEKGLDLMVMLTHKRGLISQLLIRSNTKDQILNSRLPIWVLQMAQKKSNLSPESIARTHI